MCNLLITDRHSLFPILQPQQPRRIGITDLFLVFFCEKRQLQKKPEFFALICPWAVGCEEQTFCRVFLEEAFPECPGHLTQHKGRV